MDYKIAVVIPCSNNLKVLKTSIPSIYDKRLQIIVFDDGSNDGTSEWIKANYPEIHILNGDSTNWWTGSVKKAVDYCLDNDYHYILNLNADVVIDANDVFRLIETSRENNNSIIASLVVDYQSPKIVSWAGSRFTKLHKFIPIYASKYVYKSGINIDDIRLEPYEVDEVHGRAVIFPSSVFKEIGNYDGYSFPQYGGDTDFSFRAKANGIKMLVDPRVISKVFTDHTSLNNKNEKFNFTSVYDYLFSRKNGEAVYVWWKIYRKHVPISYFLQSYLFTLLLNIYRKCRRKS